MEVYTGYGDKGMTDLSHTKNVSKSDDRICLMGSVEELMSHIGLVRDQCREYHESEKRRGSRRLYHEWSDAV